MKVWDEFTPSQREQAVRIDRLRAEFERALIAEAKDYGPLEVGTGVNALLCVLREIAECDPNPDQYARVMADSLLRRVWNRHVDAKAGPMPAWWAKGN
jgi:hypothetical protein